MQAKSSRARRAVPPPRSILPLIGGTAIAIAFERALTDARSAGVTDSVAADAWVHFARVGLPYTLCLCVCKREGD